MVPALNAQIIDSQATKSNTGNINFQVITLYLPGWVAVAKAKAIACNAAANSKYVYLAKPIFVIVTDIFAETFMTQLQVKYYVMDTRYEFHFASSATERAKAEFLEQGFSEGLTTLPNGDNP